jgi:hypothetical protein
VVLCKIYFVFASFSLGFAGEEDDGRKKERFYRQENEEAVIVIEERDVDKNFGRDIQLFS